MALCVLFFVIKCQAKTKRVLFIGNSLTYYNNMVDVLKEMIKEQGADIAIYNITPGGATLSNHIKSSSNIDLSGSKLTGGITATRQKILSEHWDFIILQEATLMCLIPEEREYSCKPAIKILNQTIKTVKARTVLYQLFALSEYPVKYCHPPAALAINEIISLPQNRMKSQYCSDSFSNSREEFNVIETFYKNIAKEINADVVKIGYGFELCKKKYPKIPLYDPVSPDHQSKQGAYLIACMFFKYLTKADLNKIRFSAGLDKFEAKKLRNLTSQIN
jgi:hypothetical protein